MNKKLRITLIAKPAFRRAVTEINNRDDELVVINDENSQS